jgi:hypothetical protein
VVVEFEVVQVCFLFPDHWVLPQELLLVVVGLEGLLQV